MNKIALWKTLLILFVMLIGFLYALPNIFGDDPALQITREDGTPVLTATIEQAEEILNQNEINFNNEKDIDDLFYIGASPDPDILIRTGGYKRLSNFIMYNLTYTELFFTDTLWPDFSIDELKKIIEEFSNIDRKYGL